MKKVFLFFVLFQTLTYCQLSDKKLLGEVSIFSEPSSEELIKWGEYDKFLLETYNYVKKEKQEAMKYPVNPFKDSIFIKKHIGLTYRDVYRSAKAYKDSLFYKDLDYKNYNDISEWALEKFPSFMKFNLDYNKYLESNKL